MLPNICHYGNCHVGYIFNARLLNMQTSKFTTNAPGDGIRDVRIIGNTFQFGMILPPNQIKGYAGTFDVKGEEIIITHCTGSLSFSSLEELKRTIMTRLAVYN